MPNFSKMCSVVQSSKQTNIQMQVGS